MVRKSNKRLKTFSIFLLIIGIFVAIIGFAQTYSLFTGQSFSVTDNTYYIPEFANIACEKTDRNTNDLYLYVYTTKSGIFSSEEFKVDIEDSQGNLITTQNDLDIYCSAEYDNVYTNECLIEVKRSKTQIGSTEYLCDNYFSNIAECKEITLGSGVPANTWTKIETISRDKAIAVRDYINGEVLSDEILKGDLVYRSSRDEFGLISLADGRKEKTNSCDLRDLVRTTSDVLNQDIQTAQKDGTVIGTTLQFGQVINYISSFKAVSDSNRLIEGNKYYSYGGGVKFPIVKGESGRNFVDLELPIKDSNIICDPGLLYCIEDGTKIDLQYGVTKECKFEGEISDWIPSSEKPNYVEKRQCVNGAYEIIESKPIPTCTGSETINQDYICVQGTVRDVAPPKSDNGETSYIGLWLLGIGVVGIVVGASINKKSESKK